ncbi:MAG: 4Fe-4S dicluster domain-containing protein [Myxococcaceae bacterium]|nr:4Fe-4S dicluster domain-containing protein [Myxococcaceae bacterium]
MNRRALIAMAATAATARLLPTQARAQSPARLRPPGALTEEAFQRACIGCFRCAEVCPVLAIRFPRTFSLESALPFIEARERACVLCMKCTQVCPTDALTEIAPQPDVVAASVRMGEPVLDRSRCLPWTGQGNCRLCHTVCPYADRAVEVVGPAAAPFFHREACVGCGLCEEACPPDVHAIRIVPPLASPERER